MTEEEAQQLLDKRIGMVVSIALYTRSHRNTLVQSVIGVEMWREGCSKKLFKIMNSLGVSQGIIASRQNIVSLQDDHDKEVKLWKGQVEVSIGEQYDEYDDDLKMYTVKKKCIKLKCEL